jgi:endonuclease/exonuclease/phosphatase (EEP) superfamily protein YafD
LRTVLLDPIEHGGKKFQSEYYDQLEILHDQGKINLSMVQEKKHEKISIKYKNKSYEFMVYVFKKGEFIYKASIQLTIMKQLKEITQYKPDIIFGDFNFNRNDKEYELLTKVLDEFGNSNQNDETTPFDTTVDFFFFRKGLKPKTIDVIPYLYSDHNFVYVDL